MGGFRDRRRGLYGRKCKGTHPCLFPFPYRKRDRTASFVVIRSWRSRSTEIADPTARVEHDGEDRRRSNIAPQLDLTQQSSALESGPVLSVQGRPPQLLDRLGRIGGDMTMFDEPPEETANRDRFRLTVATA